MSILVEIKGWVGVFPGCTYNLNLNLYLFYTDQSRSCFLRSKHRAMHISFVKRKTKISTKCKRPFSFLETASCISPAGALCHLLSCRRCRFPNPALSVYQGESSQGDQVTRPAGEGRWERPCLRSCFEQRILYIVVFPLQRLFCVTIKQFVFTGKMCQVQNAIKKEEQKLPLMLFAPKD